MCWLLDYVPIVGTAKNTLECGEALLNGDGYKALQKGTSAVIGGILDILTFGAGSTVFNFEKSGVLLATNVVGRYCAKKALRHLKNERGRKRRKDSDDHNDRNKSNNPSITAPKRGHHVINNVLRVYKDIVDDFVKYVMGDSLDKMIESGRLSEDSTVVRLINQPVPDRVANFIRRDMTVYFGRSEDTNATTYGKRIKDLRNAVVSYMEALYNDGYLTGNHDHVPAVERNFCDTMEGFIAGNYFVDEEAKKEWLKKESQPGKSKKKKMFEESREEVINMFRKLTYLEEGMVGTWVKELWEARETKHKLDVGENTDDKVMRSDSEEHEETKNILETGQNTDSKVVPKDSEKQEETKCKRERSSRKRHHRTEKVLQDGMSSDYKPSHPKGSKKM